MRTPSARAATPAWIRWDSRSSTSTPSGSGARPARRGAAIDAAGAFPDGTAFHGLAGLKTILLSDREQFVRTVAEKLTTYALGRGVQHDDMPAVRRIVRESAPHDYRWSSIVLGIARSMPFQMRRSES